MASLDKAFIKAYRQQDPAVSAIPLDTSGTQSLVEALEDRPLREAKKQTAVARHNGVLAALQTERLQPKYPQVVNKPAAKHAPAAEAEDSESEACNGGVPPFLRRFATPRGLAVGNGAAVDPDGALQTGRTARIDAGADDVSRQTQVVPPPHIDSAAIANDRAVDRATSAAVEGSDVENDADASDCLQNTGSASEETSVADTDGELRESSESDGSDSGVFRPVLQVESLAPSSVGERLQRKAAAELDRLADVSLDMAKAGKTVLGFASDHPGQGTTTLLGCVALRLAQRGQRVAMVDANLSNPQLAEEMGLLPECGWEKTVTEPIPLEELVVESVRQSISLLPLCLPCELAGSSGDFAPFREAIGRLRQHYELVLVDLGVPGEALIGALGAVVDTVLLVRDVRSAQPDRVFGLHRTLNRAGVNVAGMIESFVRGE